MTSSLDRSTDRPARRRQVAGRPWRYGADMTKPILEPAFGHHIWSNEQVLGACGALTDEQLATPVPGTYGPIIATLRHLIQADSFYLWVDRGSSGSLIPAENTLTVAELRAANDEHAGMYRDLLARELDPDADVPEHGPGWDFVAPMGVRIAQIVHHGSDHRSQICTGLTALGIEPPEIDLWAYGRAKDLTREVDTQPV
jgi:uncharacterized damage-inducible protein DinB